MDMYRICFDNFLVRLSRADMDGGSDGQATQVTHSNCLSRIVGVKLTGRHRLETFCEQCGTSSLELMACRWTL
eukprot:362971-Chlamydomonas_euryale.AAC.3